MQKEYEMNSNHITFSWNNSPACEWTRLYLQAQKKQWYLLNIQMELSFQSLYECALQTKKNKPASMQMQRYFCNAIEQVLDSYNALQSFSYSAKPMICFFAQNGAKPREILAAQYADRVVEHWYVTQLVDLFDASFIYNCAANRINKGTHFAVQRLQKGMRSLQKEGYYMQLDIANFFYSISIDILRQIMTRAFANKVKKQRITAIQSRLYIHIFEELLRMPKQYSQVPSAYHIAKQIPLHKRLCYAPEGYDIPIGNLSSQFFSNMYLNELDRFVVHTLKCTHYVRYVDDFVLLHKSKIQLELWYAKIEEFLYTQLSLRLRKERTIAPIAQGANFLGYIVRPDYCLVRRRVIGNLRTKLRQWYSMHLSKLPWVLSYEDIEQLRAMLASYLGHCTHAHTRSVLKEIFTQYWWLWVFVIYNPIEKQITQRWKPYKPQSFIVQWSFFSTQYPQLVCIMQKGNRVCLLAKYYDLINSLAQELQKDIAIVQDVHRPWLIKISIQYLSPIVALIQSYRIDFCYIAERGYETNKLKKRVLRMYYRSELETIINNKRRK